MERELGCVECPLTDMSYAELLAAHLAHVKTKPWADFFKLVTSTIRIKQLWRHQQHTRLV